ncbi:MAG: DnaA regulatory inactivator Hda [Leptothrix sp. (in: b-proteobacteria)]
MSAMQQVPLALSPEPSWGLDTFVPGANAQWQQVQAALDQPDAATPLYLWGPPGSGKTHLLRAAAAAAHQRGLRVTALNASSAIPDAFDEQAALLVLDDCEQYDALQQHAAFACFVQATTLGIPVLAAGRLPPVDLPLRDDLRSRLGWGLVYQLVPPSEEQIRALLRREGDRRGILLPDEVMDHLLKRCTRDLSHLMRVLDRLDHEALAAKRAVTLPLLRQVLAETDIP